MPISLINPFMTSAAPAAEVTRVVTVADVAASLNGKYFLISDVNGRVSVTLQVGRPEQTTIDFTGIDGISLNIGASPGKYLTAHSGNGAFAFWFNVNATQIDPMAGGYTMVEVSIANSDLSSDVASKLVAAAAANGFTDNGTVGSLAALITNDNGDFTDIDAGTSGAAVATTVQGITPGSDPGTAARNIFVPFVLSDTDVSIAMAIETALNTDGAWSVSRATATLDITDAGTGPRVDAADVDTGFTIAVTTQGA